MGNFAFQLIFKELTGTAQLEEDCLLILNNLEQHAKRGGRVWLSLFPNFLPTMK